MTVAAADICEVVITAGSADWLANFTHGLVEDRLAACGQNITQVRSIYRWRGNIEDDRRRGPAVHR